MRLTLQRIGFQSMLHSGFDGTETFIELPVGDNAVVIAAGSEAEPGVFRSDNDTIGVWAADGVADARHELFAFLLNS